MENIPVQEIKLFYKQAQQAQQVEFDIKEEQHKVALESKIKSLFPREGEGEVEEVETLSAKEGEGAEKSLDKKLLFKFLNQKIKAEAEAEVGAEQKHYHEFLNAFLKDEDNKDFAVEFLATNPKTAIALMEINNEVVSESNDQLGCLQQKLVPNQNNQPAQNKQQPQENEITKFIKSNLQDFLTKFFTVETTDERRNLLQDILKIEDINVVNIETPQEENNKKRFIETFLTFFNENLIKEKATTIIKKNLNDFTEELLKKQDFEQKQYIKLFEEANQNQEVVKKIAVAIQNQDQDQAKTNATIIAFNNVAVLEKVLETADIATNIEIQKETILNKEVATKLSELTVKQQEGVQKTNAKALIVKGITEKNKTIVENLTAKAIETLELEQIKALGSTENLENLNKDIASDLNTSDKPKVTSLAKKIALLKPEEHKNIILKDDFALSKQLNKTLTGVEKSVITEDNLAKIKTSIPLLTVPNRTALDRKEITEDNKVKMSSIKLGLVNATQKSANNNDDDDAKKLKTTLKTASSLIESTKSGDAKDENKVITAKDITNSAVDFNRDRLKLLGFYRELDGNNAYKSYKPDKNGEETIKEFKKLTKEKEFYKEDNTLAGDSKQEQLKNKWKVKLAFIEFMGYRTPEELSLLKKENNKGKYTETETIEKITKEIQNKFGWTLETGDNDKKKMKLTYKEPNKKDKVFTDFVQQSINFLKIAEEAEKARANQDQQRGQPGKTLKGSLGVKKAKLEELSKNR